MQFSEVDMAEEKTTIQDLLDQGIQAIRAKDKAAARHLLTQASDMDPANAAVWFWLSAAVEDPYEQERILLKVADLDPENTLAVKGLAIAQQRIIETTFDHAVTAVKESNPELARDLLSEVIDRDEGNLAAWELMSQVVQSTEDQEICFNNILALDPDNREVQGKLDLLLQARGMPSQSPWMSEGVEDRDQFSAPTLAGDILGEAYREKYTTVIPEPETEIETPTTALWAKYDNHMKCPYCASMTTTEDRRCPNCGNRLWISSQYSDTRSTLLWIIIVLQAGTTILLSILPLILLFVVAQRLAIFNFFSLLPPYLGLPSDLSPNVVASAFEILPKGFFYVSCLPALLTLFYTIALYMRWRPVFYMMLVSAILGLAGSIASLAFVPSFVGSLFAGVIGILLSLGTLVLVIKLETDFRKTRRRLYLNVDNDVKEGVGFLLRGKQYARKGMWALAAIHFRRAIGLMPYQEGAYLATAVACANLDDYALARAVLEDALDNDPDNSRLNQALDIVKSKSYRDEEKVTDEYAELSEPTNVIDSSESVDNTENMVTESLETDSNQAIKENSNASLIDDLLHHASDADSPEYETK